MQFSSSVYQIRSWSFVNTKFQILLCKTGLHQELPPEGPQEDPHRGEALRVLLERMLVEVCPVRRADEALQETHRVQALQVPPLRAAVLAQ